MPDYTSRADELLKEIEAIQDKLPEEAPKKLREAVTTYLSLRKQCLDDLLAIVSDASESTTDTAGQWRSRCESMRSSLADPFENALKNVVMPTEAAVLGYGWQMGSKVKEEQFFSALSQTNPASVRDYMVANAKSLKEYIQTLDEKWKRIVSEGDKLHDDEQRLHKEMVEMVRGVVDQLTREERTFYEKTRAFGQRVLQVAAKAGDVIEEALDLPESSGDVINTSAETLAHANEVWLTTNRNILGRVSNYQALVQAEKGGVLPLFKETRRQVAEYWEKNGVDKARNMINSGKESLDRWVSSCPTSAQRDDAKRFYDAAYAALEARLKTVEETASEFEKRWNGVFKGALSPDTLDELLESSTARLNASTLAEIGTPELVDSLVKKIDGYFEESFEEPLEKLKERVSQFPPEHRENGLRAVEKMRTQIESSVSVRIKALHEEVARSLDWFRPSSLEKTFDRSGLKDGVE